MSLTLPRRLPIPPTRLLLQPIEWLPQPMLEALVARVAQHLLAEAIEDGSLDLLEGHILAIRVTEPDLRIRLTLQDRRLRGAEAGLAQVTISAAAEDLLLLAAGQVDPDTLFFHRRLRLSGDTELGLAVKNVLDTIDLDAMPALLRQMLGQLADGVQSRRPPAGR